MTDELKEAEARGFARAIELAAGIAEAQPFFVDTDVGKRQAWVKAEIAEKIRALRPDPSLVVVRREDVLRLAKIANVALPSTVRKLLDAMLEVKS